MAAYFCAAATARTTSIGTTPDPATLIWQIDAFSIDKKNAPYPFSKRIAYEQDWDDDFTHRAIAEYKRFICLAVLCDHGVTPSFVVDEVWHTHLIFTRSYWEEMGDLVGKLIHHDPGQGEPGDEAHFARQYERTLEAYRKYFGEEPPADIWGAGNRDKVLLKGRKTR